MDRSITADEINALVHASSNPLWRLILDTINVNADREIEGALLEGIANEVRAYNSGRASSLRELHRTLLALQESVIK